MGERRINRDVWAEVVAVLIERESGGNKTAFARLIGVKSTQTVDRWLKGVVDVSESNVRQVARACGLNAAELLVRLGYYGADEVGLAAPVPLTEDDEEAIQRINASPASPATKRQLVDLVKRMRLEHERQRLELVEQMLAMQPASDSPDKPRRTARR